METPGSKQGQPVKNTKQKVAHSQEVHVAILFAQEQGAVPSPPSALRRRLAFWPGLPGLPRWFYFLPRGVGELSCLARQFAQTAALATSL